MHPEGGLWEYHFMIGILNMALNPSIALPRIACWGEFKRLSNLPAVVGVVMPTGWRRAWQLRRAIMASISRKALRSPTQNFSVSSDFHGFVRRDWLELALAIALFSYAIWLFLISNISI